jgi:hypothetical protein
MAFMKKLPAEIFPILPIDSTSTRVPVSRENEICSFTSIIRIFKDPSPQERTTLGTGGQGFYSFFYRYGSVQKGLSLEMSERKGEGSFGTP